VISGFFAGIFSHVAKAIFDTSRPAGVLDHNLFHIIEQPLTHSAMPSGHTMTAFSIATAIYFSIHPLKRGPWSFVFFIAMATGLSRIAVGAHWPEDVLVGSSLGMISGIIGAILGNKIPERFFEISAWPAKIVFVSSFICFYLLITSTIDFAINYNTQIILAILIALTWIKIFPKTFLNKH
jgi:membrane-associated phospholipid phosphatase